MRACHCCKCGKGKALFLIAIAFLIANVAAHGETGTEAGNSGQNGGAGGQGGGAPCANPPCKERGGFYGGKNCFKYGN